LNVTNKTDFTSGHARDAFAIAGIIVRMQVLSELKLVLH